MGTQHVRYEKKGEVGVLRLDDGKVNALSHEVLGGINQALDAAEKDGVQALAVIGRPGKFSAGFDLSVMQGGVGGAVLEMVTAGAEVALRFYAFPSPVVVGCSGHALAMGAVLLLACDTRIGAAGAFKIGLNEVSIGMTLPDFAIELSRERLSRRHLTRAVAEAEIYTPESAVDAGFLDRVVAPEALESEALAEAERLTSLDARAHHETKLALRRGSLERLRASLR